MHTMPIGCLLALTAITNAQDWAKQAPLPTEEDLNGVAFITPEHGFVSGNDGLLLQTRNGGDTWEVVFRGTSSAPPIYDMHFQDMAHGWAVGTGTQSYRTTDGGENWLPMGLASGSLDHLVSFSPTNIVMSGGSELWMSDDGGQSWQSRSAWPECPNAYGTDFRDEQVGLISGDQLSPSPTRLGIYRTDDGGRTWNEVLDAISNDVVFMDGDRVLAHVASGGQTQFWYSDDAGLTWHNTGARFGTSHPESDLERVDANTAAAISPQGEIWMSEDGGFTWTQRTEPIGVLPMPWKLHFMDRTHGFAVGPDGLILATSDGGDEWRMLQSGMAIELLDLEMVDDTTGFAAGGSHVLRTTNGGRRWEPTRLVVDGPSITRSETVNAVQVVADDIIVAAGDGGVVYRSIDGGDSWASIGYPRLPDELNIEDVEFVSTTEGWVVGNTSAFPPTDLGLYHTTDGGLNWFRQLDFFGIDLQFIDSERGWMQMGGARQWRTTNGGDNWTDTILPDHPLYGRPSVRDMEFASATHGWVVGSLGYVARTTDGGLGWEFQDLAIPGIPRPLCFAIDSIGPDQAVITAYDSDSRRTLLIRTTDGGDNWTSETVPLPSGSRMYDIQQGPRGGVWMAGFQGEIYHKPGITCRVDLDGDGTPTIFDFLAFQNAFDAGDPIADFDGDGSLTIFDFLTFQNEFDLGCE